MKRKKPFPFLTVTTHDIETKLTPDEFNFLVAAADTDGRNKAIAKKLNITPEEATQRRETILDKLSFRCRSNHRYNNLDIVCAGQVALRVWVEKGKLEKVS